MQAGGAAFANMRARLQRLKDAKFFSGWVQDFDERDLRVRLSSKAPCEPGDRFAIEIYGPDTVANLQAVLTMTFESQIYLTVNGQVHYRPSTENARICVNGLFGTITMEGVEVQIRVADISKGGLGLVVPKALPRKEFLKFKLCTPVGEISGEGEVRYCRPDPSGNGSFRVGLRLEDFGRLEKARWLRLFDQDAA